MLEWLYAKRQLDAITSMDMRDKFFEMLLKHKLNAVTVR